MASFDTDFFYYCDTVLHSVDHWCQNCFPQNSGGPHSEEDCFYKAVATVPPFCIELSAL